MVQVRLFLDPTMNLFRLEQSSNKKSILSASILGIWLHITLDSILYMDIQPLFPIGLNPFYIGIEAIVPVYDLCRNAGGLAVILFLVLFIKNKVS